MCCGRSPEEGLADSAANAQLINTETGEIQMDFKSGYYKPKEEAADRGERIARTTLEKLATLTSGGIGAIATAPPPRGGVNERIDDPPPPPAKPPPANTPDVKPNPYADPKPSPSPASNASASPSPSPSSSPAPAASPSPAPRSPSGPAPSSSASATAQVRPAEPDDSEKQDSFRASVVAGSALVHTYSLSTASGAESTLSYNLSPMALFAGDAEYIINKIDLGVGGRVLRRPAFSLNPRCNRAAWPRASGIAARHRRQPARALRAQRARPQGDRARPHRRAADRHAERGRSPRKRGARLHRDRPGPRGGPASPGRRALRVFGRGGGRPGASHWRPRPTRSMGPSPAASSSARTWARGFGSPAGWASRSTPALSCVRSASPGLPCGRPRPAKT